jgi:hypothetical protein
MKILDMADLMVMKLKEQREIKKWLLGLLRDGI